MSSVIFQETNLGRALREALDDMGSELSDTERAQILSRFDATIASQLTSLPHHASIVAQGKVAYRYSDEVWTINLQNVALELRAGGKAGKRKGKGGGGGGGALTRLGGDGITDVLLVAPKAATKPRAAGGKGKKRKKGGSDSEGEEGGADRGDDGADSAPEEDDGSDSASDRSLSDGEVERIDAADQAASLKAILAQQAAQAAGQRRANSRQTQSESEDEVHKDPCSEFRK